MDAVLLLFARIRGKAVPTDDKSYRGSDRDACRENGGPNRDTTPLPLPLLGGRNLLDNCYLHFYPIEEKISNKVGGKRRLEEKKRKNARPSLPQLCLAIHTFQSSYFHRNLEYPSRTNDSSARRIPRSPPPSFFFFLLF